MSTAVKHHFVQQFLLRNFVASGNSDFLYVYDKRTDRVFPAAIENVAAEKHLYDFQLDDAEVTVESWLADFESAAAEAVHAVLRNGHLRAVTLYERVLLSGLVAHLLVRAPQQRAAMRHMISELRQKVAAMGTDPDRLPELKLLDTNEEKIFTVLSLEHMLKEVVPVIAEKCWVLHSTAQNESLYVSDNPVVMHNELSIGPPGNLGLAVAGVEVYLPLSRNICLAMYCPKLMAQVERDFERYRRGKLLKYGPSVLPDEVNGLLNAMRTGDSSPLPAQCAEFVNSLQVWNAERYVYSGVNNFTLAREMIAKNPHLRTGGPRAEVV
ncbi:MAG TPA: DUF4238 domain-containing protein [Candidatus Eisenbacteria bacterium]|nr:DUF4238 domain-containing protein [Candidatus Eisenbacteria bacterium]